MPDAKYKMEHNHAGDGWDLFPCIGGRGVAGWIYLQSQPCDWGGVFVPCGMWRHGGGWFGLTIPVSEGSKDNYYLNCIFTSHCLKALRLLQARWNVTKDTESCLCSKLFKPKAWSSSFQRPFSFLCFIKMKQGWVKFFFITNLLHH